MPLLCRNQTSVKDIKLAFVIATATLGVPTEMLRERWEEVIASEFQNPIGGTNASSVNPTGDQSAD